MSPAPTDASGSPTPAVRLAASAALLANALVWGLSWWPFRRLDAAGLHGLWTTTLMYSAATLLILAWRPGAWRGVAAHPGLWWLALASGLTNAGFNWGVTIGEVVRVVLLFYLMPVWAALLARVLLGERLTAGAGVRIALALSGAGIVLSPEGGGAPVPGTLADWLGVTGGFGFALTNVLLRREAARPDSARALAMFGGGVLVPGATATVLSLAGISPWPPAPASGWIAGTLALALAFLAANLALQYGAARLPATVTAVILISEVVFASVSAVSLGEEVLTARKLLGGALILGAALLASVAPSDARPGRRPRDRADVDHRAR